MAALSGPWTAGVGAESPCVCRGGGLAVGGCGSSPSSEIFSAEPACKLARDEGQAGRQEHSRDCVTAPSASV